MANPYPAEFMTQALNTKGNVVRIGGLVNFTDPGNQPGGGGFTGWTEDASNPANVSANGGSLDFGAGSATIQDDTGSAAFSAFGNLGECDVNSDGSFLNTGTAQIAQAGPTSQVGFFGATPVAQPVVPTTLPSVQDVIDALVALGLVAQHD